MSDILNGQVLILPIDKCAFSAGYKNKAYLKQQGYSHYGVDLYSTTGDLTVYACGEGKVVACGWDGVQGNDRLGNVIAIIYENVYIPNDIYDTNGNIIFHKGDVTNLTCRMFHLSKIYCSVGQLVTKDTHIADYGNTGSTTVNGKKMGLHLHIEFDTDTNYPCLAPGVTKGGAIFNRAAEVNAVGGVIDSTIDPSLVWALDSNQTIKGIYSGWYEDKDINLQKYTDLMGGSEVVESNSTTTRINGIDVSYAQTNVDYNKVKESGIKFIMIRLGYTYYEGGLHVDKMFETHYNGAKEAGLEVGVYVYAYDKTKEASKKSAEEVVEKLKDYQITYPVAYEFKDASVYSGNSKSINNDIVDTFMSVIEDNGYYAMLYSYTNFFNSYLRIDKLTRYDIWLAHYADKSTVDKAFNYTYGMWQYIGANGTCPGVPGACGRDYAYQDYAAIIRKAGLNHLTDADTTTEDTSDSDKIKELEAYIEQCEDRINDLTETIGTYETKIENIKEELTKIIEDI